MRALPDRQASSLEIPRVRVEDNGVLVRCYLHDSSQEVIGFATARLKVVPKGTFLLIFESYVPK